MPSEKVLQSSKVLEEKQWTVAFVESCTAGRISAEYALVPGSGKILIGGIVCYDASLKETLLDVPHELIEKYTPESAEVTEALAKNFCIFSGSDICIAVTGLIAPGGSETPEKPVGTVFLNAVFPNKSVARRVVLNGSPEEIVLAAVDEAASIILEEVTTDS